MSKLAALAARRRQKENEKQQALIAKNNVSVEDSASSLDKLKIAMRTTSDSPKARPLQPRRSLGSNPQPKQDLEDSSSSFGRNSLHSSEPAEDTKRAESVNQPGHPLSSQSVADLWATPSAFARVLMPPRDKASPFPSELSASSSRPAVSSFDFSKPSPDDVVLKAQNFKGPR